MPSDRHIHIYDETAEKEFCKKLEIFHEKACYGMSMWGYARHGTDLESIPMITNGRLISDKLSKKLVGAFLNTPAQVIVRLQLEKGCSSIDMFYYEYRRKIYLVQVVTNFPSLDKFTFEVFPLEGDLTMPHINIFWVL